MYRQNECIPLVCIPTHDQLKTAVQDNNLDLIHRLINNDSNLLFYIYTDLHKTILQVAVSDFGTQVKPETIKLLIDLGADIEEPNENYENMRMIHFTAETMRKDFIPIILDEMSNRRVDFNFVTTHGNTALMHVLKDEDNYDKDEFLACVDLLSKKIDINIVDNNNVSAVYYAAKKGLKEVVEIFRNYQVDVDSYKDRTGKSARDLILKKGWFLDYDLPEFRYFVDDDISQKIYLNTITEEDINDLVDPNKEYHNGTVLQLLVQRSRFDLIQRLLENPRIDPNKITTGNKTSPVDSALERGDFRVLNVLLRHPNTKVPSTVLTQGLSNFKRIAPSNAERDYKQCASVCLDNKKVEESVNVPGIRGNYPLHYACRYTDEKTILALLAKKASLANRSGNGYLTMNDIHKRTLESHLDSCLAIHETNPTSHSDEKEIRLDFTTLLPAGIKDNNSTPIEVTSNDKETFGKNYSFLQNADCINRIEMDVPIFMSQSEALKPLLTHPILAMFIYLKWQQVSRIYKLNLIFYLILCIFLYAYIFLNYINEDFKEYGTGIKLTSSIIHVVTIACLVALILREAFQVFLEFFRYIRNIENFIELTLIITMVFVLFINFDNFNARKQVASIAILFSALELFLLIGKKPNLSTNIVILRTVSLTFFKLLLWYSVLICAFALSFYTLFSGEKQAEGDDPNFFANPAMSAIKTIVMLTGEFDASSIKFDSIPIISHFIFLMFVFMISMVLFNLLNGLAVTDTQEIKSEAELYSYVSQIQYIAYIEGLLMKDTTLSKLAVKTLCRASYFSREGPSIMSVPLHQGTKSRAHFIGDVARTVPFRQSLIQRAKLIIEERRMEHEENRKRSSERDELEAIKRKLDDIFRKLESLPEND